MLETKLWAKLRPKFQLWGECDRVENSLSSGMSDIFYNFGGQTGWVETKVAKSGKLYFQKFQPNWIRKHVAQGARVFVIAIDDQDVILVFDAKTVLRAPMEKQSRWTTIQLSDLEPIFSMSPPYRDWDRLRTLLTS